MMAAELADRVDVGGRRFYVPRGAGAVTKAEDVARRALELEAERLRAEAANCG